MLHHLSFSERGGEPPTPTKTPTSANFLQASFETPKQESSFYDPRVTWDTANPCAASPDFLKTPKYLTFATPKGSPLGAGFSRKRRWSGHNIEDEIASHVHHLSPNPTLTLPPVEPSRQLSSSPNPSLSSSSTKRSGQRASKPASTPLKLSVDEELETSMRSAGSMQTPPPTSTSASRRKTQQAQAAKFAHQSSVGTRRMSTPTVPRKKNTDALISQIEESPLQLGDLQFSPDAFGFPLSGPSTAPVYPQHKLFWDPEQSTDGMSIDFPTDDPFTFSLGSQKELDTFVSTAEQPSASQLPPSSSFNDFNNRVGSMTDAALNGDLDPTSQTDFLPACGLMIQGSTSTKLPGKGVNPSLLFSSPGRQPTQLPSTQAHHNDTLQPYAHQIREAQIENELALDRRAKKRRKPATDSPAVKAALQTLRDEKDLQSDDNETATDRAAALLRHAGASHVLFQASDASKQSFRGRQIKNSVHPRKTVRKAKKRPVVTLTIDADGRAKTETKSVCDDDESFSHARMELDSPSEDSETTSSSGSTVMILSQPQSFTLPQNKHRNPKLARFATNSRTHSQRSSYASTMASSNSAISLSGGGTQHRPRIPSLASGIGLLERTHSQNVLNQMPSTLQTPEDVDHRRGQMIGFGPGSETETAISSDEDKGDAQFELKKIVRSRGQAGPALRSGQKKRQRGEGRLNVVRGQQMTHGHCDSFPGDHGRARHVYDSISPTTITDPDLATPSTGGGSIVGESTRCVCHRSEPDDELMILW